MGIGIPFSTDNQNKNTAQVKNTSIQKAALKGSIFHKLDFIKRI
jgi:hypothetical protein